MIEPIQETESDETKSDATISLTTTTTTTTTTRPPPRRRPPPPPPPAAAAAEPEPEAAAAAAAAAAPPPPPPPPSHDANSPTTTTTSKLIAVKSEYHSGLKIVTTLPPLAQPPEELCGLAGRQRVECGFYGITRDQCVGRGCCYKEESQ